MTFYRDLIRLELLFLFSQNPESDWQKVDYLMEFGEWLFVNEYPVADALDQVRAHSSSTPNSAQD